MSTITTTIRLEDSQFFSTLNRIEGRMSSLATGFAALSARMAVAFAPVAAGIGVVAGSMFGLKKSVEEAANMEQLLTSFEVLIGSADVAKETLRDLQKFADETTFQMPELSGAAKQLIAFGVGANEVVSNLRMLGDVAAGLNIPLSELVDVYGRNLVQGRLFSRDIYQFQSRGIPIIAALAKQFNVAESEIMGMIEAGRVGSAEMVKAFQSLTAEGGVFAGMLQRQSRTFNGLMSTLADNIRAVFREFGTPLLDAIKPVIDGLIARVKEMAPAAKAFGETVARIIMGLQNAFVAGNFSEAVGLALELGFARAMNALAGGLETTLAITGAAFTEMFGNADFWAGLTKTLLGVAGQFGAALLQAVETPLSYVQAFFEKVADGSILDGQNRADHIAEHRAMGKGATVSVGTKWDAENGRALSAAQQEEWRRWRDAVAAEMPGVLADLENDDTYDTVAKRAARIRSEGGVRFGFGGESLTASGIALEGQAIVRDGIAQMKQPTANFLEAARLVAAAYKPAALYDESKLKDIESRLRALFPELPQAGSKGDAANARSGKPLTDIAAGNYTIVADSLAKIGGGGGVAGINAALEEARQTNSELRTANKTLAEVKQVLIAGRINGQEIRGTILR